MKAPDTINLEKLETEFEQSGLDALVAASGENVFYFGGVPIRSDLGWERLAVVLWQRGDSHTLIVSNVDESLARARSWIEDVRSYVAFAQSPLQLLAEVLKDRGLEGKTIGVEKTFLTAAQYEDLVLLLPTTDFVACDHILASVRACKRSKEIMVLKEGFNIAERAIHAGFSEARVGMPLKEVLDNITAHAVSRGADRGRSSLLCASSPSHSEAGVHELQPGDLIQLDFVGGYKGYRYDIGRTAVVGNPSAEQQDVYHRVREVARKTIAFMSSGVRACDVYIRGLRAFQEEGLPLAGIKVSMGHGIGLDVHEDPILNPHDKRVLEPNMTFCVEPVYMIPGVAFYHIEDLVRITDTGGEVLSNLFDTSDLFIIGD